MNTPTNTHVTDPYATHFVMDLGQDMEWTNFEGKVGPFPRYGVWAKNGVKGKPECVETFQTLDELYKAWPELKNLSIAVCNSK